MMTNRPKKGYLSPNFTYREFSIDSLTPDKYIENSRALAVNVLEPLREILNGTISVRSGYRTKEKNEAVGGVKNSQHLKGQAADIQAFDKQGQRIDPKKVFKAIRENLEYDQLINYLPGAKGYPNGGNHVSYVSGKNRKQIIIKTA